MNKPHKHAEVIKAWADGAEIEVFYSHSLKWQPVTCPTWCPSTEYRVKPEPKPDIPQYVRAMYSLLEAGAYISRCVDPANANIKLVFDGETRKLKSVELINKE